MSWFGKKKERPVPVSVEYSIEGNRIVSRAVVNDFGFGRKEILLLDVQNVVDIDHDPVFARGDDL